MAARLGMLCRIAMERNVRLLRVADYRSSLIQVQLEGGDREFFNKLRRAERYRSTAVDTRSLYHHDAALSGSQQRSE
jgi:hypothetical protein